MRQFLTLAAVFGLIITACCAPLPWSGLAWAALMAASLTGVLR